MNDASSSPRHAKRAPGRQTRNRKESVFFFRRSRITVHDVKAITASNVSIRSSASFQVTNVRGKSRVTAVQGVDWSILPWLEAPCFFLLLLRDSSWTWQPIISKRGLSPKKNDRGGRRRSSSIEWLMMRHTSWRLNNIDDGHMWNHQAESKQSEICPAGAYIHLTIITFLEDAIDSSLLVEAFSTRSHDTKCYWRDIQS
ncbi:hypothetical protein QR685DRAFT_291677 [Neurospora intermedia]|uniref:Uncharacterized protein n=1 Tax=Neurospora intermedia TaxID=5142 RepID=A0ABR3DA27_NEUIN